jgi:hypothetical protein
MAGPLDRRRGRRVSSQVRLEHLFDRSGGGAGAVTKRFDEEILVDRDAGMPAGFEWRGRRYQVVDVIGRWRIEGRWWDDGRDREYWRVEAKGGAVWDLYHDRQRDRWHVERLWD